MAIASRSPCLTSPGLGFIGEFQDFLLDLESFAFFNYQYILYGMEFKTDLSPVRDDFPNVREAEKLFARIRNFGERATHDLPSHRALIEQINTGGERLPAT